MKPVGCKVCFFWVMILVCLLAIVPVPDVMAADGSDSWRVTYDQIMRWVNFIILAAVIIKFGRRPLMNFLSGRQEEIAYEIRRLEKEKEAVMQKVGEMQRQMADSDKRYEQMKERIIAHGGARKQAIIDEAHRESRVLMETTRNHIQNQLRSAKRKLRAEIIDLAVDKAIQRLPGEVTAEDDRKLVEKFIERATP